MEGLIIWILLCFIVAATGSNKNIGYWGVFFWALILSPLIGLIIGLVSKPVNLTDNYRNKAMSLRKQNKFDEAITSLNLALSYSPGNTIILYDMACCHSLNNKTAESFQCLSKAVDLGYSNFAKINTDKDLQNLRESKDYKDLSATGLKDSKYSQLDQIGKLKELFDSGALTELEFAEQKKILLNP